MKYLIQTVLYIFLVLNLSCKEKENVPPTCEILSPADGDKVMQGDLVKISAEGRDSDGTIVGIKLFIGGVEMAETTGSSLVYEWNTENTEEGGYIITAVARDDGDGGKAANITVLVDIPGGLNPDISYGELTDYDGNSYTTLDIGDQTWMAENLTVTHYADGSAIPGVEDESAWGELESTQKAYCWYENLEENEDAYGALYTWAAALNGSTGGDDSSQLIQGVCPDGWHLPKDAEWKEMEMFLGMSQDQSDKLDWRGTVEGAQMKERGFSHWEASKEGGTNSSGFTALPGGFRSSKGEFYSLGNDATFWTADAVIGTDRAWYRTLNFEKEKIYRHYNDKKQGFSVRCVKDPI